MVLIKRSVLSMEAFFHDALLNDNGKSLTTAMGISENVSNG